MTPSEADAVSETVAPRRRQGVTLENAGDVVRYHRPGPAEVAAHEKLAAATEALIRTILEVCPPCADTTAAVRKAREAKMTASAAVALDGAA